MATVVVATLPIGFRRRAPLAAASVVATWPLVDRAVGGEFSAPLTLVLGPMLVTYTLAAHAPQRRAVAGIAVLLASFALAEALRGGIDYGLLTTLVAVPAVSGFAVRRYRALTRQLAVLTARLELERGVSERLAVAEERRRIARELHDAIAHAVSRMVVQAAAAEQVLATAPDRARGALVAVQDTGRDAICELRYTLRILRADDRPAPPVPGAGPDVFAVAAPAPGTFSWPWWADILLAAGLVGAVDGPVLWNGPYFLIVASVGAVVAIALRRRHPVGALALAVTEMMALTLAGYIGQLSPFVTGLVVLYTLATNAPPRILCVAAALAVGTVGAALVAVGAFWVLATHLVLSVAVCAAGLAERAARRQAERLQKMAARLARERDARARLAVIDERAYRARAA
jgi:signal transduction histidine kinase